jgi:hypothetical protein
MAQLDSINFPFILVSIIPIPAQAPRCARRKKSAPSDRADNRAPRPRSTARKWFLYLSTFPREDLGACESTPD